MRERERERERERAREKERERERERERESFFVVWLLQVLATCLCISGTYLQDNFTWCHTEKEVTDQMFYLTQSHYNDNGPTSHSADSIMPGGWQGSHLSANF